MGTAWTGRAAPTQDAIAMLRRSRLPVRIAWTQLVAAAALVDLAEDKLLFDLAAQVGLALQNLRLIEELKASRQRIIAAQDAKRRRLERDIHDVAQRRLVTLSLAMRIARTRVDPRSDTATVLEKAAQNLTESLNKLRELARGVHPAIVTEEGLIAALLSLAERSTIPTTIGSAPAGRLPAVIETTSYELASRALGMTTQAGASCAEINAKHAAGTLIVEVTYDTKCSISSDRMSSLAGLDDRVAALGGRMEVDTASTFVRVVIPCE